MGPVNQMVDIDWRKAEMKLKFLTESELHARLRCIPIAEAHANKVAGRARAVSAKPEEYGAKWNRYFHRKMEMLVREVPEA